MYLSFKTILTQEVLEDLFIQQKWTIVKISKYFKCSRNIVYKYLIKYKLFVQKNKKLPTKNYCCMDCGNLISEKVALQGRGYCKKCKQNHSKKSIKYFCTKCGKQLSKQSKSGYCIGCCNTVYKTKIADKFCIDCGKKLNHYAPGLRCYCCNAKYQRKINPLIGEKNPNFKGGDVSLKCDICGKEIFRCRAGIKEHNFCSRICYGKWISLNKSGENASNWQGGIGNFPYPFCFDDELKEKIRTRDNFICQCCRMTEEEHLIVIGTKLHIHHIDYNKENCNEENLITVCTACNTRANYNKDYWINFYRNKICFLQ